MSRTSPERTVSRKFNAAEEIGKLQALVEKLQNDAVLLKQSVAVEIVQAISDIPPPSTMAAKNTLSFSGDPNESVDDLINDLRVLKIANNWSNDQLYGQAVCTLKKDAKRWYRNQDVAIFVPTEADGEATKFDKFAAALAAKFKPDRPSGEIVCGVLEIKQKRSP